MGGRNVPDPETNLLIWERAVKKTYWKRKEEDKNSKKDSDEGRSKRGVSKSKSYGGDFSLSCTEENTGNTEYSQCNPFLVYQRRKRKRTGSLSMIILVLIHSRVQLVQKEQ